MHFEKPIIDYNYLACIAIIMFSFFSINSLGFNPAYIFIVLFISVVASLIFLRGRLSGFSAVTFICALFFCVSQFIALRNTYSPLLLDENINYLSCIIFVLSFIYAVPYYEFFRWRSVASRFSIYKWAGVGLCFYLILEGLSRFYIGDIGGGLLYGFKKSLFYFDSNFTGLIVTSFVMFFIYIRNIGAKNVGVILLILFFILILTMSRAAIATIIVSLFIFHRHGTYKWKSYISLFSYIIMFVSLSYVYLLESVNFLDIDGSFNSKFYIVRKAMELYESLPLISILFGVGLGNFDKYTGIFAHNIFVTMMLEMGVIGTLLFVFYIVYSIVKSNGDALYIWLPTLVCGISLFGVYSPFLFLINAAILLESNSYADGKRDI